jgi:hypothetical protein
MPDYSKAKIYKIVVDTQEEYKPYVGSTIQTLSNRMSEHRSGHKYKKYICSSFILFERFGVDKCKIILIEEYPCDNYEQLLSRERYWFDSIECCNKIRPFTTKEEKFEYEKKYRDEHKEHYKKWTEDNKDQLAEYHKEYYKTYKEQFSEKGKIYREQHKEELAEKAKKYQQDHKEEIAEKKKEKYEKNKEEIAVKRKETYECSCGSILRKDHKVKHEKTKKHISFISK